MPFSDPSSGSALPLVCLVCASMSNGANSSRRFTQQAARFTDVHGITGRADDGVHDVGGSARELSLWTGKWDNASLLAIGQLN